MHSATASMQQFYSSMYRKAKDPHQLPWHREVFPDPLLHAIEQGPAGKALDLGCGTGVYATFLAEKGYQVTALDFVASALAMARQRAAEKNVTIDFIESDILEWQTEQHFDLVFDSGCLHGIADQQARQLYKNRLLQWLTPTGQFVLIHFLRRHFFDWRPIGPRRRTRAELNDFLGAELVEKSYADEVVATPLLVGPNVKLGYYRFVRAQANS